MEVAIRGTPMSWRDFFLKDAKPFTTKRDVNWFRVKVVGGTLILAVVMIILLWPSSQPEQVVFHEKAVNAGSMGATSSEQGDPTQETVRQIQDAKVNSHQVHSSLDYLYKPDRVTRIGGGAGATNKNAGMILARNGFDSRTQLPPGTRMQVRLIQGATVAEQAVPVIGIVLREVQADYGVAIPAGSKVLGEVSFNSNADKVNLIWKSIILPDRRERPFSAIGMDSDGHSGLAARIRSESVKNAIGQTLTKFVGAYAAGSMNTGAFGANPGGGKNGLRNAIAETATERANAMGEELQKERKWAELESGLEVMAVLSQPFSFRDPGGAHGG